MARRLLVTLVLGVSMLLALPTVAGAKDGGKSPTTKDCQQNYADFGFRNSGQCVKAGGSQEDPLFRPTCEGLGGVYAPSGSMPSTPPPLDVLAPACSFTDITNDDFGAALEALRPYCLPGQILSGEYGMGPTMTDGIMGCRPL